MNYNYRIVAYSYSRRRQYQLITDSVSRGLRAESEHWSGRWSEVVGGGIEKICCGVRVSFSWRSLESLPLKVSGLLP